MDYLAGFSSKVISDTNSFKNSVACKYIVVYSKTNLCKLKGKLMEKLFPEKTGLDFVTKGDNSHEMSSHFLGNVFQKVVY